MLPTPKELMDTFSNEEQQHFIAAMNEIDDALRQRYDGELVTSVNVDMREPISPRVLRRIKQTCANAGWHCELKCGVRGEAFLKITASQSGGV